MDGRPPRNPGEEPSAVLTREAFERLRQELDELTSEGRSRIAERLLRAREHGDIRENAEYDAAKDEQGLMEARIRDLQRMLKDPDIAEVPTDAEVAGPGILATLRPLDEDDPEDELYLLAATKEERASGARTVSVSSPLGQALLGRRVGDRITYQAPGGLFAYEVVALEPFSP
jgi:transcription elongation factor GreA